MTLYSLIASSLAGPGAPANTIGVDGAIYLDLSTGRFYGPKTAGAWPPLPGSISAIQDEGSALTTRAGLNFTGAGVTATDDAANNRTNLTIPGSSPPALVTSLPGSPTDGQETYYQSSAMATTDGVVWSLRYRSASSSAYKWEFAGGNPLLDYTWIQEDTPRGGSLSTTPSVQATTTAPLNGDYRCDWMSVQNSHAGVTETHAALYKNGVIISSTQRDYGAPYPSDKTGVARLSLLAGDVITLRSWIDAGSAVTAIWSRSVSLMPFRVG